jgi:hypothetical protein
MSRELLDFLRARLQDDEDYARTAFADHNDAGPKWYEQWSGALNIGEEEDLVLTNDSAISRHMERHDPAHVLADVEAKREVLRLAERAHDYHETFMNSFAAAMEDALRLFAQAYADHPDYREEWRPTL